MMSNKAKRTLCALLAAALLLTAAPFAMAESGNPFEEPAADTGSPFDAPAAADSANLFEDTGTSQPAGDIFGIASTPVPVATQAPAPTATIDAAALFNLDTPAPAIGSSANADPFAGATASSDPFASGLATSIPGYNPFDPDSQPPQQAVAANSAMFVTASTTKIRRRADDYGRVIMTVPFGTQLTVSGTQEEWAAVTSPTGKSGYCLLADLSASDPNTLSKAMYVQTKRVSMNRMPVQRSRRYRWLNQGDTVTMTAISSDGLWARVSDGANYGFVPTIALDDMPAGQSTPMWCADASTPVLVNPDSWKQIGSLSLGQSVGLVGYIENNTIAKVRSASGYVAYCAASALSATDPASMNTPVYTQVSGRILYRSASEEARTANIGKNARLTLLGVDSSQYWALVKYGRRKFYVPYVLVGPSRLGKGSRTVVTTQDVQLYRNNNEVIATLPTGTRLYLTAAQGSTARVATIADGVNPSQTGFVALQSIRGE